MSELDRLLREDPECAEIVELMLAEGERELSEFEARRVQQYVERCPAILDFLEGRTPESSAQDELWDAIPVPMPTEEEWRAVDIKVHEAMAAPMRPAASVAPAPPVDAPRTQFSAWQTVAALAAMLLLAILIVDNYSGPSTPAGTGGSDEIVQGADEFEFPEPEFEITELPEDVIDVQIDDVEGMLMIYVSSG
ncbi:MAG: hypothetical protein AAF488_10955 [Planctomycetota bacterium]